MVVVVACNDWCSASYENDEDDDDVVAHVDEADVWARNAWEGDAGRAYDMSDDACCRRGGDACENACCVAVC